jgi:sodium transport system permease protein
MSHPILTIWKKELTDTVRDKRTLASTIILPLVLMPALFIGISKFSTWQVKQLTEKEITVAVSDQAGSLGDWLTTQDPKIKLERTAEPLIEVVRDKKADVALDVAADWPAQVAAGTPTEVTVITNSTNTDSSAAAGRVSATLNVFNQQQAVGRLAAAGLSPTILTSFVPKTEDVASAQEQAGFGMGFILPLFIIMWAVTGGQTIAIDASAGERERKTIEALLLTPVSRFTLVAGKFLAVATGAMLSVIISITSMTWASKYMTEMINSTTTTGTSASLGVSSMTGTSGFNMDFNLDARTIVILLFVSVILVALFSAGNLAIAIFAKNYKEAQSYIGPMYLVVILPVVFVNSLPSAGDHLWTFAVPIVNAVVLFKEVLVGNVIWSHIIITTLTLLVTSLLAMWGAARIYRREDVIFTD